MRTFEIDKVYFPLEFIILISNQLHVVFMTFAVLNVKGG